MGNAHTHACQRVRARTRQARHYIYGHAMGEFLIFNFKKTAKKSCGDRFFALAQVIDFCATEMCHMHTHPMCAGVHCSCIESGACVRAESCARTCVRERETEKDALPGIARCPEDIVKRMREARGFSHQLDRNIPSFSYLPGCPSRSFHSFPLPFSVK